MTVAEDGVDALRARPDADPDSETPVEIVIPVERPDDPDGECDRRAWLTLPQQDAVDDLLDVYPDLIVEGSAAWVPRTAPGPYPLRTPAGVVLLATDPTALVRGCWIDLAHPALTGV